VTILPSPIPHPRDYQPWDLPGWARDAVESAAGPRWPEGDETATWDVADRWYALARLLAEPRLDAIAAAGQVIAGYGADGFVHAWHRLADDDNAPLNSLLEIGHEIGTMVEQCGSHIERAKLAAWIELGALATELTGMSAAAAVLPPGAAPVAAAGLIAATRTAIQQVFEDLAEQLGQQATRTVAGPDPVSDLVLPRTGDVSLSSSGPAPLHGRDSRAGGSIASVLPPAPASVELAIGPLHVAASAVQRIDPRDIGRSLPPDPPPIDPRHVAYALVPPDQPLVDPGHAAIPLSPQSVDPRHAATALWPADQAPADPRSGEPTAAPLPSGPAPDQPSSNPSLSGWTYSGSSLPGPMVSSPLTSTPAPDAGPATDALSPLDHPIAPPGPPVTSPGHPPHAPGHPISAPVLPPHPPGQPLALSGLAPAGQPQVPPGRSPTQIGRPPAQPGPFPAPAGQPTVNQGVAVPDVTGLTPPPLRSPANSAPAAPQPTGTPTSPSASDPPPHEESDPTVFAIMTSFVAPAPAAPRSSKVRSPDPYAGRHGYPDHAAEQLATHAANARRAELEALHDEAERLRLQAARLHHMAGLARQVLLDWHVANLHDSSADTLLDRAERIGERIAHLENGTIPSAPPLVDDPTRHRSGTDTGPDPDEEQSPAPEPQPDDPPAPTPDPKVPQPAPSPIPSPRRPVDAEPRRDSGPSIGIVRLDGDGPRPADDPDLSRRTSQQLLAPLTRDPKITVAVADGRDVGLTIDAAVRGIRQAIKALGQGNLELPSGLPHELRLTVLTADGTSVTWQADTATITVSV
jgi:hypothetical protein